MPPSLPPWLSRAYTESHISLSLLTLAERESQRDRLRHRVSTSLAHTSPSPDETGFDHYSIVTATNPDNTSYNRYRDVVPYDRTRVIVPSDIGDRYLNANWVLERCGHKWWIATQAPLPTTAHTFLSLIMQPVPRPHGSPSHKPSSIRTVVQLTRNVEMGRTKAHAYFPAHVGESIVVPADQGLPLLPLRVALLKTRHHEDAECIQSTVAITPLDSSAVESNAPSDGDANKQYIFQHLMYTAWPDHGIPADKDRDSLLAFLKLADRINRDTSLCKHPSTAAPITHVDPDPPMIVGCSAGIGRTGTFIALSSLLRENKFLPPAANPTPPSIIPLSPLGALPAALSGDLVAEEVDFLREQRPRMVERPEQLLLLYEILVAVSQNT